MLSREAVAMHFIRGGDCVEIFYDEDQIIERVNRIETLPPHTKNCLLVVLTGMEAEAEKAKASRIISQVIAAIDDYVSDVSMPIVARSLVYMNIPKIIDAIIKNEEIKKEAIDIFQRKYDSSS